MDIWTIALVMGGVYIALCIADKVLQKYRDKKKAVIADDGTASAGTVDASANIE